MNSFGILLKRKRTQAGLSQEQVAEKVNVSVMSVQNWESGRNKIKHCHLEKLAYIYNIPVNMLVQEMHKEDTETRSANWPSFLFDENTNEIISSLHLNLKQQALFGLLYLYEAEYLKEEYMNLYEMKADLQAIPYEFINSVGSIQLLNIAEGLHNVLRYVQTEFLMKVLRINPEEEFDICKLNKSLICEFIDSGYKKLDDSEWDAIDFFDKSLRFEVKMQKAEIILPILEQSALHLTDDHWSNELNKNLPKEVYKFGDEVTMITAGLQTVTKYYADEDRHWMLEINDKGRSLLKWFRNEE